MAMAFRRKLAPRLAISMGDPAGIGPEVILKAAAALAGRRAAPSIIVIGDLAAMRAAAARFVNVPVPREWHPGEIGRAARFVRPVASAYFPRRPCPRARFGLLIHPWKAPAPLMITL